MENEFEKLILVGVGTDAEEIDASLNELSSLVDTAGGVAVGRMVQLRESPHPATYIGTGKVEELKLMAAELSANGIVTDDELTPAQMKHLEDALNVKVLDRTMLILDIFACRASSREGKLQVELAELKYRMTRLLGSGNALSRLGGGIGTRGPGESKLETDRRRIRSRITTLKQSLDDVVRHRELTRRTRSENNVPVIALIGYTNAGKSTLLNALSGSNVLSEDKLFATLDPTTRKVTLPGGETVLFTDTVGFINKLPHQLIEAFRSTLEEAKYADIITVVADAASPDLQKDLKVVSETMAELHIGGKPVITVYNKWDKAKETEPIFLPGKDRNSEKTIRISALTGEGLDAYLAAVEEILKSRKTEFSLLIPYSDAGKTDLIRRTGTVLFEEYRESGIYLKCRVPKEAESAVRRYAIDETS